MEESLFRKIVADLKAFSYSQQVSLFGHNEALLDKRLPDFIAIIKAELPDALQTLSTNGDKLTVDIAGRLFANGLDSLLVNLYDDRNGLIERAFAIGRQVEASGVRLLSMGANGAFPMIANRTVKHFILNDAREFAEGFRGIDNRAGNVAGFATLDAPLAMDCERPLIYTHIKWNGDMILCCQDWKSEVVFGNLNNMSVIEAFNSDIAEFYRSKLAARDRTELEVCRNCQRGCNEWSHP